ncbi:MULTISPECIES: RIP metalloprotease RseP [Saccharibacillus]|uniref:Zinc metalloprotease n=2 Tax=Saccharibacillus TaxID=456492 RepID=A0A011A0R9_9BACL|nr:MULTISPECIES: RIP metalloprotease RseP [Saccharibacillus]EXG83097.1 RIP metalloprotease RseP [Saccharibacillus sacchari DSM 19268]GGH83862.1 zinc metalloprotease [Saccharibacillus endophyticus]
MMTLQIVVLTVLMFFVVVTVHEWGHYYFAKRAGILVREFAIGFGPKLFSYKRDETMFTLRLLPLGGYARMAGEDPELDPIQPGQTIAVRLSDEGVVKKIYLDQLDNRRNVVIGEIEWIDIEERMQIRLNVDGETQHLEVDRKADIVTRGQELQVAPKDRQFRSKSVGKRALAIFAGPLMNFVLAFVLFLIYVQVSGVPDEKATGVEVADIVAGTPADSSDLVKGDIIQSIDGQAVNGDLAKVTELVNASGGSEVEMSVQRGSETVQVPVTPKLVDAQDGSQVLQVGIQLSKIKRSASFTETFEFAGKSFANGSTAILDALRKLVFERFDINQLAGPVGTLQATGEIASQGIDQMILWTALVSINLGIFNLLPIPMLDGSRLIFLGIEAVRRRPIDPNKEGMVHFIGFALIFLLMIAVTYNDILRIIKG